MKTLKLNVHYCARCGKHHDGLAFVPFKRAPNPETHWAMCPKTREPILCIVKDDKPKGK